MGTAGPPFTRESASALLREVAERLTRLREALRKIEEHRAAVAQVASSNGGAPHVSEWFGASREAAGHLAWFGAAGIVVRSVEDGLVDFPAVRAGREIFLCWRLGEPAVDYWHEADTGFSGRRPL